MSLTSWSAECTQSYEKFSCNAHLYRHVGNHHCLKLVQATQCQQRHSNIAHRPGTTITVVLWFPAILYYLILPDEASTDTTAEVITTISLLLCVCINSGKNLGLLLVLQICTNYLPHFVTFSGYVLQHGWKHTCLSAIGGSVQASELSSDCSKLFLFHRYLSRLD